MNPFLTIPGAITGDGVVQHVGDPLREQRALTAGRALAPLGDRVVVEVHGPDRLTWLDSITSQALTAIAPGQGTELLVLDPNGRIEHVAGVIDDGASAWLIADADDAAPLAAWLSRMVFRAQVTVVVRTDLFVVGAFVSEGSGARAALGSAAYTPAGIPLLWEDPWRTIQPGGHQYHEGSSHPAAEYRWGLGIVDEAGAQELITGAAAVPLSWAGTLAAEALRVATWRPRWAAEIDERSIPHEYDWLRSAVHLDKGCYRGQETVAKVHFLGHPPRRLAMLHLDGSESVLPVPGDAVLDGEQEVGAVTSVARHYELGPIALAVLSRRASTGELRVRASDGEVAAAQEIIVPADAGATADVPRLTRLSRRPAAADPRDTRDEPAAGSSH